MAASQLWAGVDVGKEHHWVCVVDDKGAVVLSRKLANDEQSIRELIAEIEGVAGQVAWTVDLTTVYASLLLTVLADAGKSVRYLAGRAVWQASVTYRGGEAKTDAKDARVIADQSRMRGADLPILHPDDDLITELRMLTAHRADLVADRTRTINRLRQQLIAVCPALERAAQITQDRGWVVLLSRYQRPKVIRQKGLSRLTRILADAGVRNAAAIAAAAVTAAKSQTVRLPGEEVAAALVAELAQGVIALDDRIKTTDTDIEGRFRRHPLAEVITSLPGMGFRLGAEFLAAVGDPALIGSADQLAAWAGLAPVSKDSGKRTGRLHTPKRYSRRLRRVMYMSALTAIRCDPDSKAYYRRKRDEGKRAIPATICLARRRTNVFYALIRDNRTWQPDSPPITESAA
ncbi:IS110 family transposase [Mycobacterium sp. TY815]|uniref:IS110 family transposase n=1 Tax=Mycobacterium sp. TY815 TaxID=3050581 RepID=UPI002741ACB5|nr:IS110 family transposase [Mycobacterium sp. TY815]MDP7701588.1 IS110 family transposase [Mycobacterium sp. TY815]MDP7702058.1 IS110 family transposase [Mycobacterium sp. TY815]MDP7705280.1 IS110 family transposase [Mycobacterium sp. TY815]MDP7706063.1 IS110 family transposase [Mycobacterium sp. TY815]MDP7706915.1 IS110 family transposase [Mycobacterium sp. TY815]